MSVYDWIVIKWNPAISVYDWIVTKWNPAMSVYDWILERCFYLFAEEVYEGSKSVW